MKNRWLDHLDRLYTRIEKMLEGYTKSGDIELKYQEKSLNEEYIGEYAVKSLRIKMKYQEVVLDPIGTNLIGAYGRVDMNGSSGTVRLVLVNKNLSRPETKISIRIKEDHEVEVNE